MAVNVLKTLGFFNFVCISGTIKVFDIIDARCNHEDDLNKLYKMIAVNFPGVCSVQRINFPFKVYSIISYKNTLKVNYNTLDFIF